MAAGPLRLGLSHRSVSVIMNSMNTKPWVRISRSFEEAQAFDRDYDFSMTGEERLEIVQVLRERAAKLEKGKKREGRKRLRRALRIIQQI